MVPLLPYMNIVPLRHGAQGQMVYYDHYLLFPVLQRHLIIRGSARSCKVELCITAAMIVIDAVHRRDRALAKTWKNRETLYQANILHAPSWQVIPVPDSVSGTGKIQSDPVAATGICDTQRSIRSVISAAGRRVRFQAVPEGGSYYENISV
jgi:hypothetical protein